MAAGRRFSCGNCLACDNCRVFCPDFAVLETEAPTEDGSRYVCDDEFRKGCGVCAAECPTATIAVVEEPLAVAAGVSGGAR